MKQKYIYINGLYWYVAMYSRAIVGYVVSILMLQGVSCLAYVSDYVVEPGTLASYILIPTILLLGILAIILVIWSVGQTIEPMSNYETEEFFANRGIKIKERS